MPQPPGPWLPPPDGFSGTSHVRGTVISRLYARMPCIRRPGCPLCTHLWLGTIAFKECPCF